MENIGSGVASVGKGIASLVAGAASAIKDSVVSSVLYTIKNQDKLQAIRKATLARIEKKREKEPENLSCKYVYHTVLEIDR